MKGYSHPYSAVDCEADIDASTLKLDPILVKGCLWNRLLEQSTELTTIGNIVLRVLNGDNSIIGFKAVPQKHIPVTAKKWLDHINELTLWGVLQRMQRHSVSLWVSGYFAVPKDESCARAVLSGGGLSRMCNPPFAVNILDIKGVLDLMCTLNPRGLCFMNLDLRHWFYQIGLDKDAQANLRKLFHTVCDEYTFEWLRLPMGWSFSPCICQTLSWLLLLYKLPHEKKLFRDVPSDVLPKFLNTLSGRGYATVLYDNFAIFSDDQNELDVIRARFIRNLGIFEVVIKDQSEKISTNKAMRLDLSRSPPSTEKSDDNSHAYLPKHLGVQMGILESGRLQLVWRLDHCKVTAWRARDAVLLNQCSARYFARIVGRIIWSHSIRMEPLLTISPALAIAKRLGQFVGVDYKRWDDLFCPTKGEYDELTELWTAVLCNNWIRDPSERVKETCFLFTDASDSGWGYVLCTPEGIILDSKKFVWNAGALSWHIFIEEVASAIWSMDIVRRAGR